MQNQDTRLSLLSFLLLFIFGGAIIGETVSLSTVVSHLGPSILSKLFIINGAMLFLLPPLFYNNIDRIHRGKFLSLQLLIVAAILMVYVAIISLVGKENINTLSIWFLILYPISYLSKTILFLTFWTIANDIYNSNEAKQQFPKIAAWGFIGGLVGACGSRLLLEVLDAEMIIGLWSLAYLGAFFISRKITQRYSRNFRKKENFNAPETGFFAVVTSIKMVAEIKLIRFIGILYFLVFTAIFFQDYLFWKKTAAFFTTSNSLASFQFSFYVFYSLLTIFGLRFVIPGIIAKWGFTRIFVFLPAGLLVGSLTMIALGLFKTGLFIVFVSFLVFQFVRYILFENTFSPIYQMFFTVIPSDKRGRAKTLLEGIIKPAAILITGICLMALQSSGNFILVVIAITSVCMIFTVLKIRKTYSQALLPHSSIHDTPEQIISEIGSHHDQKLFSIIREYTASADLELRALAIRILASEGSKKAFRICLGIFSNEENAYMREMIARSIWQFHTVEVRVMLEAMLYDENIRIRANALYSLNQMHFTWKWQLKPLVKQQFLEGGLRVQIEAAQYLWISGTREEKEEIEEFLEMHLFSRNTNKRSAGVYLVGMIKPPRWEQVLCTYLNETSDQVFEKCLQVIFASASIETKQDALKTIEGMDRKHIAICGTVLKKSGMTAFSAAYTFLKHVRNKRMMVELLKAMAHIAETTPILLKQHVHQKDVHDILKNWILKEFENQYLDCIIWNILLKDDSDSEAQQIGNDLIDGALREQLYKVCEWALHIVALLNTDGVMVKVCRDMDLRDKSQRSTMIELLEAFAEPLIAAMVIPVLRLDSWEDLSKTGKSIFKYAGITKEGAVDHFINHSNRWLVMCTLYRVWYSPKRPYLKEKCSGLIERLKKDPSASLQRMLDSISKNGTDSEGETVMEPFDVLQRVMVLKKTQLFHNVPAEKLMELAELTTSVSHKKGTLISREGELSDHLYLIASGSIKIVKVKNNVKTILSIIEKGETYGEIGLLDQAPRSASAIANDDCVVWVIQRSSLKRLLLEMPEIAYNLLEVFSEKLRKVGEEVSELHMALSNTKKEYIVDEV